jgi:uncharacterized membrane protein YgcG
VDSPSFFRAYVIFALATIIKSRTETLQTRTQQPHSQEELSLIDKLVSLMEVHLVCSNTAILDSSSLQYDYPLLFLALQRLINSTLPLVLAFAPTSPHLTHLIKMWSIIRRSFQSSYQLQDECAEFLLSFSSLPKQMDAMEVVDFIKEAMKAPERTTTIHLSKIVDCVKLLVLTDTRIVVEVRTTFLLFPSLTSLQFGLDVELFKLLDWCVAASTASFASSPFWGVELRSDITSIIIGDTTLLQRKIEEVMNLLVILNVQNNPDQNGTAWVLLSRVIALGLKEQTSTGPSNDLAQEDGEGPSTETTKGDGLSDSAAAPTTMSYIQYSNWCRDVAIERGRFIQSTRLQLKYLSLRCAITAIIECKSSTHSSCHSDLLLARTTIQDQLATLKSSNKEELCLMPCFMSLFMNDLISMGCACASFSIDDHRLLGLQTIALEYLQAIVDLFWQTLDPDDLSNGVGMKTLSSSSSPLSDPLDEENDETVFIRPEKKIMNQYMAQIISAIRPTLSTEWSPSLLLTSGNLIFGFIACGLLTDKIIIKRLVKSFLSVLESSPDASTSVPFLPRCYLSLTVRSDIAVIQHVNIATNMARVYLLSTPYCSQFGSVDAVVQETIRSAFASHLSEVFDVWVGIIADASRMLQGHQLWPKITPETDCRRGGITYPPHLDCLKIYRYYLYCLPELLAAVSMASPTGAGARVSLSPDHVVSFLAIDFLAMQYLHETQESTNKEEILLLNATEEVNRAADDLIETQFLYQNIQTLSKPLLLAAYNTLLEKYYCLNISPPLSSVATTDAVSYPLNERILVARYVTENLLHESSVHLSRSALEESMIKFTLLTEMFHSLLTHLESNPTSGDTPQGQDEGQGQGPEVMKESTATHQQEDRMELILVLWIAHQALVRYLFLGMYAETVPPLRSSDSEEDTIFDIYTASHIFPTLEFQSFVTVSQQPTSRFWINSSRGLVLVASIFKNLELIIQWIGVECGVDCDMSLQFRKYFFELITSALSYTSLHSNRAMKSQDPRSPLFSLFSEMLCGLSKTIPGNVLVLDGLMSELWKWHQMSVSALLSDHSSSSHATPFPPLHNSHEINTQLVTDTAQVMCEMWITVAVRTCCASPSPSFSIPSSLPLTAIFFDSKTPSCFLNGILLAALKYLQTQAEPTHLQAALTLLTSTLVTLCPHLLLARISSPSTSSPPPATAGTTSLQTEILLLQLFFLIFNLASGDEIKSLHLKLFLPALCTLIRLKGLSDPLSLISGKGITHIARTAPLVFKTEIMLVSDENKLLLQNIMKAILEQQQSSSSSTTSTNSSHIGSRGGDANISSGQSSAGGSVGGFGQSGPTISQGPKKIDMSKFKKSTPLAAPPLVTTVTKDEAPGSAITTAAAESPTPAN